MEQLLDDLWEKTSKAHEKAAKGEDTASEIEAIKSRKTEIEALDADLRKDFAATEKKLKDANLPKDALTRHYKFVKSYETNLSELKANLKSIEQAKTSAEVKTEIAKAKKHLNKIKPVKKRIALDPKKLPHQARPLKHAALEEKKEEKKIPPMQPFRKGAKLSPTDEQRKNGVYRPVMVASNGPLDGLISNLPAYQPVELPFTGKDFSSEINPAATPNLPLTVGDAGERESEIQLANIAIDSAIMNSIIAATLPASDADLVETPEVQFTQRIKDLAAQLNYQPAKIFFWVYNNIDTVPTYGSIQGADMCLQTKVCNPIDTVSLMIALYRVSGVHARYTYGTIQIEIDKIMRWLGVTDPRVAGTILASNGIPVKLLISGGTIKYVQMDHVWVTAWIDYIPSRGAVHKQGDMWLQLDPSIKFYTDTSGLDIQSAMPFDAQTFADQIQSTATINQTDGSVTNVNSALIQQTMQDYQTRVQNYIQQNYPNATVGDVLGKREIKQINWGILPDTRMFKVLTYSGDTMPDSLRATISFSIPDPSGAGNGLSYTTSLPQITGKKITLSFSPATSTDQAAISLFNSTNGSPSSLPAYLINVKAELRINGQVVASGTSVTMGHALSFTISLNEPGIGLSTIDNIIQAGEYYGIGLDTGRIGDQNLFAIQAKLVDTKLKLESKQYSTLNKDDLIGDLLYATIATYFAELDINDEIAAQARNIVRYRAPSIGMCSLISNVSEVFGVPTSITSRGMMMDIDRIMQAVLSKDGNMDSVKRYMLSSGTRSSILEHLIPERLFSVANRTVQGFSAVKALQLANDSGIPLFTIDQSNIDLILSQLQVDQIVKSDIANAVNAGKAVTISKTNVNFNGTSGCGYIIIDPNTFAGAYMINNLSSGGLILEAALNIMQHYADIDAEAAEMDLVYSAPVVNNNDPIWENTCIKYFHYAEYWYCVGDAVNARIADYFDGLLVIAVGTRITGRFAPLGFVGAVVFSIGLLALTVEIGNNCRQKSIHC